jgi:hypothetical protein
MVWVSRASTVRRSRGADRGPEDIRALDEGAGSMYQRVVDAELDGTTVARQDGEDQAAPELPAGPGAFAQKVVAGADHPGVHRS